MERIDERTVELTAEEQLVCEIHSCLLDCGIDQGTAVIMMTAFHVEEELRTATPMLDRILTPEFRLWLTM
jgi:hypothetical protein